MVNKANNINKEKNDHGYVAFCHDHIPFPIHNLSPDL